MNYIKLKNEVKQRKEQFIADRANIEKTINDYGIRLSKIPEGVIDHLQVPEPFTARSILPSMYDEPFEFSKYEKERDIFDELLKQFDIITNNLMKEAEDLLRK